MSTSRRRLLVAIATGVAVLLPLAGCAQPVKAPPPLLPPISSMAAMGDSISRAFDACNFLQECLSDSWATGTDPSTSSHYSRLLARNPALSGHALNVAQVGAASAELPAQASAVAVARPDYVTMLMGSNDACVADETQMTPAPVFRSRVDQALSTIYAARPDTRMVVASVPDLYRLWQVAHTNTVAQLVWSAGFCRTMLDNPTSTASADNDRRLRVRAQLIAYNGQLAAACHLHPGCRFDDNAVFDYPFTVDDLSPFDFFHPNPKGQAVLASITWAKSGN